MVPTFEFFSLFLKMTITKKKHLNQSCNVCYQSTTKGFDSLGGCVSLFFGSKIAILVEVSKGMLGAVQYTVTKLLVPISVMPRMCSCPKLPPNLVLWTGFDANPF